MADLLRMQDLTLLKLLGEITPEQEKELQELAKASEENRLFIERMHPMKFRDRVKILREIDSSRLDQLLEVEVENIDEPIQRRLLPPYSIAAATLVLLSIGWWLVYRSGMNETAPLLPAEATLRWSADSMNLGEMMEGKAYKAGAIQIARMGNEFFVIREPAMTPATAEILQYELNVGGKENIQVFFPDSTRVQIYPNSSISFTGYPSGALLKEKRLSCNGQVLFNASHHCQIPLVIEAPKQKITVLGTLFEVRDYSKEDTGAVFCYTGKVSVKAANNTRILSAMQRLTTQPKHKIKLSMGDFPQAQWSSPELFFDFTHLDLDSAMNEIASWYGFTKIVFQHGVKRNIPGMVYAGLLSRYLTLNQLLSIIERSDLHFSIQEQAQTILVSEN